MATGRARRDARTATIAQIGGTSNSDNRASEAILAVIRSATGCEVVGDGTKHLHQPRSSTDYEPQVTNRPDRSRLPDGRRAGRSRSPRAATTTAPAAATQTSAEDVKPVAQIDNLTGVDTAVTLDTGFVDALTKLKVTPGPVGDAEISKDGVASFPITGGNVTYYDPASPVRPYVQGVIDHEGSGLSLTAGKTEVELTDFVIDPGTSELTGTVSVNGKEAATDALLFDLDGSTLEPLKTNPDGTRDARGHDRRALRRRGRAC